MRWRTTGSWLFCLGLLVLVAYLLLGCDTVDSGAAHRRRQAEMPPTGAGEEQLGRVTLRITGMS
jgi:hypothetical protein